jgi:hypothetical protein
MFVRLKLQLLGVFYQGRGLTEDKFPLYYRINLKDTCMVRQVNCEPLLTEAEISLR